MRWKTASCAAVAVFLAVGCAWAGDDVVLQAMRDELARSMQKLQLEKLEKPYFISYRVSDYTRVRALGTFGSLLGSESNRTRWLNVEIRVGNYALDNTNFLTMPTFEIMSSLGSGFGGNVKLPLEDDYQEIRRQIWLATDARYKKALEDLSKKRAALQNKTRTESTPDFSHVEPTTLSDVTPQPDFRPSEAEALVRELSGAFREMPDVFSSTVEVRSSNVHSLYVNSEGTSYVRDSPLVAFSVNAETQAPDGMPLTDSFVLYGRSAADLPTKMDLLNRIRSLGTTLGSLRKASLLERYNGPVLLEGQAAAEAFGQVFVPRLSARQRPVTDTPQFEAMLALSENPFLDKIGARVLPASLTVTDNPTLSEFANARLIGGGKVDDEGVPTRETRLVEKGVLKTLLATRSPARGILQSTGSRHGSEPKVSNLIVSTENGKSEQELKQELLRLAKERNNEFAVIIRRISNSSVRRDPMQLLEGMFGEGGREPGEMRGIVLAYKVYSDGHEELIRNAVLSGLTVESFKDIVGVSRSSTALSEPFASRSRLPFSFDIGALEGGPVPVSLVVPSLLFEDLTLKKPGGEIPKPPVVKHPFFDR